MDGLQVYELHKHKEFMNKCVVLLNSEWPRTKKARLHSLQASCDNLPTSLVLIFKNRVVGHSKLSRIPSMPEACMIESVIVHKKHRGKGWGKYLMEESENYAKRFEMEYIYLTTTDKVGFYEKLDYKVTEPIGSLVFGNPILMPSIQEMKETLLSSITNCMCYNSKPPVTPTRTIAKNQALPFIPPPPPPPLPPVEPMKNLNIKTNKTFMKKRLQY